MRGEVLIVARDGADIVRALPHGHVAAVLGSAVASGLIGFQRRFAELALALIVGRLIDAPSTKRGANAPSFQTLSA
jgi:hypothetical protein